jgi:hypothetical protein
MNCVKCKEPLSIIERLMPFSPKICTACTEKELQEAKKKKCTISTPKNKYHEKNSNKNQNT